ncbi:response regulator transcription factor [Dysgonomonas macrotermitis]|uniref:DNA-binding response regulator, OmpR family, contains REC and winged-helix (WHTH) domain n=1 Tax=Dysgonomonas macrotermitis TaxID=1346286 RepID=A0A1M4W2F0_9BACT|nr:response regulator transcription factor [Dysgonomonas macrotermitis]SHE75389.1 DNA-binding response regulator, OmpR family, contains REC and winged-helix (wHTH) domain [Dysgonomonas macrotermitis]
MKILLIEDERDLSNNIVTYLTSVDYLCEQAFTYSEAIDKIDIYTYDCILLDLNLPGGDGLKILETIKERNIDSGVIIISARGSLDDKIKGLLIGADDYLAKPFPLPELSIRIYALLRRQQFSHNNTLVSNGVVIHLLAKTVFIGETEILLTKSEYELLLFLVGNKNKVISKNAIAEHLSGDMADMLDSHSFVYAHIKNLKSKLHDAGCEGCIKTVYGTGYKWEEEND